VDFYAPQFDAPSRFLVALPILLFVLRSGIPVARILSWVLPLSLAVGLVFLEAQGADPRWPAGRETTRVVDPLVFGYLTFTFGLMCLVTVSPRQWREAPWGVVLRLAGAALGLYLSLRSGSRTGWLALPLVVGLWLYCLWRARTRWAIPAVLLVACASPVLAYLLVPTVGSRIDEAAQELLAYPWEGMAPDTSLGGRITALRIAFDLFVEHPWAGRGNLSHVPIASLPSFSYASPWATKLAYHSAFHNQIVTNAVRTGVGGLLATAALLLVPLAICTRSLLRDGPRVRPEAAMGFAFFACMLVSSMSTEIVDLKYMASLYAVMTAVLCGACLAPPREGAAA
jgi:O-antigen ligase